MTKKTIFNALSPNGSNGDLLDGKKSNRPSFLMSIDYLVLNLDGAPVLANDSDFIYNPAEYGTKNFAERGEIIFQGKKIGTFLHKPKGVLKKSLSQFQLENYLFYTLTSLELLKLLRALLDQLGVLLKSVSRLDVCIDMSGKSQSIDRIIKKLFAQKYRLSGRTKNINFYTHTNEGALVYEGVSVGSRNSSRYMRLYDKTLEQKKSIKTYIADAWKYSGLKGQIWRMEYQMSNRFLRDIPNVTLENICDSSWLYELFKMCVKGHFEVRQNTGKTETNKERSVNWINFDKIQDCIQVIARTITRLKRNIKETLIGQQRMVKGLLRSYFSAHQNPDFLRPMNCILEDYDLVQWFRGRVDRYVNEFIDAELIQEYNPKLFKQHLPICH